MYFIEHKLLKCNLKYQSGWPAYRSLRTTYFKQKLGLRRAKTWYRKISPTSQNYFINKEHYVIIIRPFRKSIIKHSFSDVYIIATWPVRLGMRSNTQSSCAGGYLSNATIELNNKTHGNCIYLFFEHLTLLHKNWSKIIIKRHFSIICGSVFSFITLQFLLFLLGTSISSVHIRQTGLY